MVTSRLAAMGDIPVGFMAMRKLWFSLFFFSFRLKEKIKSLLRLCFAVLLGCLWCERLELSRTLGGDRGYGRNVGCCGVGCFVVFLVFLCLS